MITHWAQRKCPHQLDSGSTLEGDDMEINTVQSPGNQPRDQLDIACRFADNIDATFGAGKRDAVPEHREIEMALVELVRESSQPRYLALAAFFLNDAVEER